MASLEALAALLESDRYTFKTLADGSGVLLDVEGMRVLSFNATAAFLLEEIVAGAADLTALARSLTASFEVDADTAARDVEELLADLDRVLSEARSK